MSHDFPRIINNIPGLKQARVIVDNTLTDDQIKYFIYPLDIKDGEFIDADINDGIAYGKTQIFDFIEAIIKGMFKHDSLTMRFTANLDVAYDLVNFIDSWLSARRIGLKEGSWEFG